MKSKLALLVVVLFSSMSVYTQTDQFLFSPKGIAEVHIDLLHGKKIGDIKNEKNDADYAGKLEATMTIKNSFNSSYESKELYNGRILIKGRGNTTWGVPKRPYSVDLVKTNGEENPMALLGMPADDEWCLLAFWHDRALMRIPLAMYLGQFMDGMHWVPRMQYVEVYINGEYRGLYCFSERIRRSDVRVDVKKLTDSAADQTEPRISGGYILEGTSDGKIKKDPDPEWTTKFRTGRDQQFIFKYPKPKNVTSQQRDWIINFLKDFETALYDESISKDPVRGYQKYIDEESFIDWTILHEMSRGVDNLNFHASGFIHKDRDGKLNMSAPWDFDLSYGNAGSNKNNGDRQEWGNWVRTNRWFERLYRDERYARKYMARYEELRPLFDQIPQIIQANYEQLKNTGAIDREEITWSQILAGFSNQADAAHPTTYKGHVKWLSDWIEARNAWCYVAMAYTEEERLERFKEMKPVIRILDPESYDINFPFWAKVADRYASYRWNSVSDTGYERAWTETNNEVRISTKGKYWVQFVDDNGNTSQISDTLYFGVPSPTPPVVAIENPTEDVIFTYSSLINDYLNINYVASKDFIMSIQLLDVKGVCVKKTDIQLHTGYNPIEINAADLAAGMYIMCLFTENGIVSKKIIKR
jgi:hypothetical protein